MLSPVIGHMGYAPREAGGTSEGSRSEVRGFGNFGPRTSNFGSRICAPLLFPLFSRWSPGRPF